MPLQAFLAVQGSTNTVGLVFSGATLLVAILGVLAILIAIALLLYLRKFIVNSILGLIALVLLNLLGFKVGINLASVLLSGLFGLLGVGILLLLSLVGIQV